MRYFCRVAYDGTSFGGWQKQNNCLSIQQILEEKAAIVLRKSVSFTGAGRTDAGVHARRQGAHFDFDGDIDPGRFTLSMNALLPPEVAVYNMVPVSSTFHARYSALSRKYSYYICRAKSPLLYKKAWFVPYDIDWGRMIVQLPAIYGRHDFSSFCASGSDNVSMLCTVFAASIERQGECMVFSITADRFLYKMVRSIVGSLIDIGRGRLKLTLGEVLEKRERFGAGTTAPACGLVLEDVSYAEVD